MLLYALFVFIPFAHSIYLSFFKGNGVTRMEFVGVENYVDIVTNPVLRSAFVHAFELIVFYSLIPIAIGLLLASVLHRSRIRGVAFYRTALFLPYVIAPTAIAVIWRWILAPRGPLNSFLEAIGLGALAQPWLGDFTWALPSVGMVGTWVMFGLVLALLLAGVQKIPLELYEAARLDGAGPWMEFRAVTLPGLRYEIVVALVLTVTAALRNFDIIYVMTSGGPGNATVVPSYLVYQQAFKVAQIGAAAAMGTTLIVVIVAANLLIARAGRRDA
ncbi:MAG: sugar ABC transporter permease [Actinomycetales bacterium]|nr:sugar ABC transporter permease [Actinomycetales bacterium]